MKMFWFSTKEFFLPKYKPVSTSILCPLQENFHPEFSNSIRIDFSSWVFVILTPGSKWKRISKFELLNFFFFNSLSVPKNLYLSKKYSIFLSWVTPYFFA